MPLAQQLDELALANSQGLLNDEDYYLLRKNLFEQHSTSALAPVEAPVLSVAGPGRTYTPVEYPVSHKPSLRRKNSFTVNVTNLLKRGGGDKTSVSHTPSAPSAPPTKRGLIPRLHKRATQLLSGRTDDKRLTSSAGSSSTVTHPSFIDSSHTQHPPNTPLRSPKPIAIPAFPSNQLNTSPSSEIFDYTDLYTTKDIRAAIIALEAEAQRLLEAFDDLESMTLLRVAQQNARRLRAATPEHVITVMDGSNWRRYTPQSQLPERRVFRPATVETVTDNSSARFGVPSNSSLSRSSSHLPLRRLVESESEDVTDADRPGTGDTDTHPEVFEVQRRRDEVIARYHARLGYLQARLKTAELHERLLRR
ncbi:hypothetical protein C0995_000031 [Termitomyces sp. Mi166|nr:hypothetical protein C0995_000031 [Termitomyces sp. Mi166\